MEYELIVKPPLFHVFCSRIVDLKEKHQLNPLNVLENYCRTLQKKARFTSAIEKKIST